MCLQKVFQTVWRVAVSALQQKGNTAKTTCKLVALTSKCIVSYYDYIFCIFFHWITSVARFSFFFENSYFLNFFQGCVRIYTYSPTPLVLGLYFECSCCYKEKRKVQLHFKMEFLIRYIFRKISINIDTKKFSIFPSLVEVK